VDEAWKSAEKAIERHKLKTTISFESHPSLYATVSVVHGEEVLANNDQSDADLFVQFEKWVGNRYSKPQ
jgi:hypothetical protein